MGPMPNDPLLPDSLKQFLLVGTPSWHTSGNVVQEHNKKHSKIIVQRMILILSITPYAIV